MKREIELIPFNTLSQIDEIEFEAFIIDVFEDSFSFTIEDRKRWVPKGKKYRLLKSEVCNNELLERGTRTLFIRNTGLLEIEYVTK